MKDNNIQKLIKASKNVSLSGEEKSAIKQSVLNFISQNPARVPMRVSSFDQARPRFWSTILTTNLNFASAMAILLIITLMVGGGVAVGAEKSLPGDVLYPVKVGLSEEVRGWLSVSEESKANWEVKRVEKRLEEAEEMAANGSLDAETRAKIEANFEAHAEKVKARIEKFETKENFNAAVDVSSRLETSLKAHQKILVKLSAESKNNVKNEVKPIEAKVRSRARALAKTRKSIELRTGVESEYSQKNKDIEDDFESEAGTEADLELNIDNGTIKGDSRLKANLEF